MKLKELLKWGNKWETGLLIFIVTFALILILFLNRYNVILNTNNVYDACIKESVKYWQTGILQVIRSLFEHFSFNFFVPIIFVIFSLGFDRLFNKYLNWRITFGIGAFCSIAITFIWELKNIPVEWFEIILDLSSVFLAYFFIQWLLKEYEEHIKQKPKKEGKQ